MAVNIGPRIGIEGEAEYRKQLNNIITSTKKLESEMKALESSFDGSTSAQEKAAKRSELLKKQLEQQNKQLQTSREMLEKSKTLYDENDSRVIKWAKSVADCETQINLLNRELANNSAMKAWGEDAVAAGEKIQAAGSKLQSVGSAMTRGITMPIAAAAGSAVKLAADFDSSMSKVQAISGATTSEMEQLAEKAREMGKTSVFSASEAADALTYMAMAGWKSEDMIGGLAGVINLAAASGEELATTSDIVTDALTAFGMQANESEHFADVLAAASNNANTNVSMMGETFKYVAPVAGSLGYSVEDVAVAIGLMANNGIKASQAGTALRSIMSRMAKPTKESAEAMDLLGLSLTNYDTGEAYSFMDIMKQLRSSMSDLKIPQEEFVERMEALDQAFEDGELTEKQYNASMDGLIESCFEAEGVLKAQAAASLAGRNALSGLLAIVNTSDADFAKLTASIYECTGTCENMANIMTDNLSGQLKLLKSEAEEVGISFGSVMMPHMRKAVSGLSGVVNKFSELSTSEQESIIKTAAFAAALGPITTVSGKVVSGIGGMVSGIGKLAISVDELGGIGAALTSTAGIASGLGVVIAASAAGAAYYVSTLEKATPDQLKLEKSLESLSAEIDVTKGNLQTLFSHISSVGESADVTAIEFWRDRLLSCYDAEGNLIEQSESLCNTALKHLNDAMGTDYTTDFISQFDNVQEALGEVSASVDDYIANIKKVAVEQAFSPDYSTALKEEAAANKELAAARDSAREAELQYQDAVKNFDYQKNIYDTSEDKIWTKSMEEASRQLETAKTNLSTARTELIEAEGAASSASAAVALLEEAMVKMSEACDADSINAASEAYVSVAQNATEWGEKAQQSAMDAMLSFEELEKQVLEPPQISDPDYSEQAKKGVVSFEDVIKGSVLVYPGMEDPDYSEQAQIGWDSIQTVMDKNIDSPDLNDIPNAVEVASSARNEIQNYFDNNHITVQVDAKVNYPKEAESDEEKADHNARGGFITQETLSWLGENDRPEVIIPLDESERGRAIDLFQQTAAILGTSGYNEDSLVSGISDAFGQTAANTNVTVVLQGDAAGVFKLVQKQNAFNRRAGRAGV